MTFALHFASDFTRSEEITISTLADLQALQEHYGHQLIVDFEEHEITIYDDYME